MFDITRGRGTCKNLSALTRFLYIEVLAFSYVLLLLGQQRTPFLSSAPSPTKNTRSASTYMFDITRGRGTCKNLSALTRFLYIEVLAFSYVLLLLGQQRKSFVKSRFHCISLQIDIENCSKIAIENW